MEERHPAHTLVADAKEPGWPATLELNCLSAQAGQGGQSTGGGGSTRTGAHRAGASRALPASLAF